MEKISSIFIPNCLAISTDADISNFIEKEYGMKLIDYPWEHGTIIEPVNRDNSNSSTVIMVVDSNLRFEEILKWAKGIFEGIDVYKNDPSKYIVINGWEYDGLPGRSYLEVKENLPKISDVIDNFDIKDPIIGGITIPFIGIKYENIKLTGCKSVNILSDGRESLVFKDGLSFDVVYTSLTRYKLLNWIKHIAFKGINIYPNEEIVVENYNEDFNELLKDCIPLYKFKENLLSK